MSSVASPPHLLMTALMYGIRRQRGIFVPVPLLQEIHSVLLLTEVFKRIFRFHSSTSNCLRSFTWLCSHLRLKIYSQFAVFCLADVEFYGISFCPLRVSSRLFRPFLIEAHQLVAQKSIGLPPDLCGLGQCLIGTKEMLLLLKYQFGYIPALNKVNAANAGCVVFRNRITFPCIMLVPST